MLIVTSHNNVHKISLTTLYPMHRLYATSRLEAIHGCQNVPGIIFARLFTGARAPVSGADIEAAAGERVDAWSAAWPGGSMRR